MSKDKGQNYEESNKKYCGATETEIMRAVETTLSEEEAWVKFVEQSGEPKDVFALLFDENGNFKLSEEEVKNIINEEPNLKKQKIK